MLMQETRTDTTQTSNSKVYFLNLCEYSPLWTLNVGRVSWPPSRSQWSPAAGGGRGIPSPLYSASPSPSAHAGVLDSMLHSNCYGNETVIGSKVNYNLWQRCLPRRVRSCRGMIGVRGKSWRRPGRRVQRRPKSMRRGGKYWRCYTFFLFMY